MSSTVSTCLERRVFVAVSEIYVGIWGEPPDRFTVSLKGILREHKAKLKLFCPQGEPASLLGWGARLDDQDADIVRALGDAEEPLNGRGIARALGINDPRDLDTPSWLRERLSPKARLRLEGYVVHTPQDGYALTEKGRKAYESLPKK